MEVIDCQVEMKVGYGWRLWGQKLVWNSLGEGTQRAGWGGHKAPMNCALGILVSTLLPVDQELGPLGAAQPQLGIRKS